MFHNNKKVVEEYKKLMGMPAQDPPQVSFINEKETTVNGIHLNDDNTEEYKKQAEKLKKMTPEEQREFIKKGRKKTTTTTLIYRNVRSNPDLVYLGLIILSCMAVGFFVAKTMYGVSAKAIISYIWEFAQIVIAIIMAAAFVIAKIYTKPGPIAESFQSNGNKENTDKYGRTIIQ